MSVPVIVDLERTGHRLTVEDGQLKVTSSSTLTDEQRDQIRAHRDRIVELVTDQQHMVALGWFPCWIPAIETKGDET